MSINLHFGLYLIKQQRYGIPLLTQEEIYNTEGIWTRIRIRIKE